MNFKTCLLKIEQRMLLGQYLDLCLDNQSLQKIKAKKKKNRPTAFRLCAWSMFCAERLDEISELSYYLLSSHNTIINMAMWLLSCRICSLLECLLWHQERIMSNGLRNEDRLIKYNQDETLDKLCFLSSLSHTFSLALKWALLLSKISSLKKKSSIFFLQDYFLMDDFMKNYLQNFER